MNMHQDQHHDLQLRDHSENHTQTGISDPLGTEANERESLLDELEKTMFERAR